MPKRTSSPKRKQSPEEGVGTTALLIIDCLNDLEFDGGEKVLPWAMKMAARLSSFRARASKAGMPVIYANDNFGLWRSSPAEVFAHATRRGARGREVAWRLKPRSNDFFILKPRHSAFYATSLEPLLQDLGVKQLVLAGIATNLCVLFTAHDAHMRRYGLVALSDCCAAESDFDHDVALSQLERFCGARICSSLEYRVEGAGRGRAIASASG